MAVETLFGEFARHIGSVFNPRAVDNFINHSATAVSIELDQVNVAGELDAVQHGLTQVADSFSNGLQTAKLKTDSLEKARMMRVSHRRHKYALRMIRYMLGISLTNKAMVMVPAFALSFLVPRPVYRILEPAFMAFGFRLGVEAKEATKHEIASYRERHARAKSAEPPHHKPHRLRDLMKKVRSHDLMTTAEITIAVLASVNHLPIAEQIPIMAVYATGMTFGVFTLATTLVKIEDYGQRMSNWDPKSRAGRLFNRTRIPAILGNAMERSAPHLFHTMPVIGAFAKYVTSGRVINHASPYVETLVDHAAHWAGHLPYVGGGLTYFLANAVLWGATGAVAGHTADVACRRFYGPLKARLAPYIPAARLKAQFANGARGVMLKITGPAPAVSAPQTAQAAPLTVTARAQKKPRAAAIVKTVFGTSLVALRLSPRANKPAPKPANSPLPPPPVPSAEAAVPLAETGQNAPPKSDIAAEGHSSAPKPHPHHAAPPHHNPPPHL